ncbi:MAG: sulfotransferase domain-containing protein [Gammaproteobacteria bacterium]|nr:sulfotransferase domain-containing protein [Gammaproteobacteria bacterium]
MSGRAAAGHTLRTVWFHRDYQRFTGGHVKHAHYVDHVSRHARHRPAITFSSEPGSASLRQEQRRLWPFDDHIAPEWQPRPRDILFVAGTDWRYVDARGLGELPNPRINLIQHVRHAHADTELYRYLARRAVRICVSQEVADAIVATGQVQGSTLTIPNGIDMVPYRPAGVAQEGRASEVTVVAYKAPALGRELTALLSARGIPHRAAFDFMDRRAFLGLLAETRVAVCLPRAEEGFYLPALEAMAAGCIVVTMDCIGNRGFCKPGDNCLLGRDAPTLADAVASALAMPPGDRKALRERAGRTVEAHSLDVERARFHAVLDDVDRLWREDGARPLPPIGSPQHKPLVDFMIVGAQKCGTTALSQFLAEHPEIGMSSQKEVHLFDAPDYVAGTSVRDIDARYRRYFEHVADVAVRGEATPIYMFLPDVAGELKRYSADLRLIVLLRDPVERALSAYYMQKARARETKPLWLALLLERWRLRRDGDPRRMRSATREHGYRSRGLYSLQLQRLYRHFDRARVLVVRRNDLLHDHDATMERVFAFLGVSTEFRVARQVVFAGDEIHRPHRMTRALLRLSYAGEFRRLRRLGIPLG